ncbi:hypothetical protein E2C01_017780 [Portunus trituberculatus]|uniref:Uncharacterized protein n=1 Tax=Portunus trituberculatus TaxID=210409 RepID=A0A5B7DSQ3_PORTR|nr:hypothetical protein [Portunus trituberculatus]
MLEHRLIIFVALENSPELPCTLPPSPLPACPHPPPSCTSAPVLFWGYRSHGSGLRRALGLNTALGSTGVRGMLNYEGMRRHGLVVCFRNSKAPPQTQPA